MGLTDILHVFYALLGVGFLIFVHELGHFLAAKKVGIRVETFSIGFQPTIFGFRARFFAIRRGETEYVLGMVPFGGYVKMAGEELHDTKTGAPDEFASQGIPQRALVLVAGATMNLIFGVIFFIVAFSMGVDFSTPEAGSVGLDSPAWKAGIQSGDRIVAIDGEPKTDFEEIQTAIALSGFDLLPVSYEREDGDIRTVDVRPVKDAARGMPTIGIRPNVELVIDRVEAGSPAAEAGLQRGDAIEGIRLEDQNGFVYSVPSDLTSNQQWNLMIDFIGDHPQGSKVHLSVWREATRNELTLVPRLLTEGRPAVGVGVQRRTIRAVQPGSPANEYFQNGWEIDRLAGEPLHWLNAWEVASRAQGSPTISFTTLSGVTREVPTEDLIRWLSGELIVSTTQNVVKSVKEGSPAAALGLKPGDRILTLGAQAFTGPASLTKLDSTATSIGWWNGSEKKEESITPGPGGELGLEIDPTLILGLVIEGKSAYEAGLRVGDHLTHVNGTAVESFADLTRAVAPPRRAWWAFWRWFSANPSNPVTVVVTRGEESLEVTMQPEAGVAMVGIVPRLEQVNIQVSVLAAIPLGLKRTFEWSVRVFKTLGALASREVDASNLVGPIGIVHLSKRVFSFGFTKFLYFLGLISINLGVFNLLPFPILDGGHLLFLAIEKIKGSPVSERIQGWVFTGALILLLCLALFVTFHDLRRMF